MTSRKNTFNTARARRLCVVSSALLALIGWIFLLQDISGAFFFSFFAVLLLTIGLLKPSLFYVPGLLWHNCIIFLFGFILEFLLILFFFLLVTPAALAARLLGKDVFFKKNPGSTTNYWHKIPGSYWVSKQKTTISTMRW